MKRTGSIKWSKLQVGALLMFSIAIMMWASLSGAGTSIFDAKAQFHCYFKNTSGMLPGSPVWMSGVEVGSVKSVKFVNLTSEKQVKVICRINKEYWPMLTTDCRVQLGTIGLLGDKYVEIIPGSKDLPAISEGAEIEVKDVGDAQEMFAKGEAAFEQVGSLISNLDTVVARIQRGEGSLGLLSTDEAFYVEMTALMSSLTRLSADLQKNQERFTSSLERMSTSVSDLSDQVNNNTGTLGKLMTDPALYDNLSATTDKLDNIMKRIDQAEGTLGLMVSDTALYVEFTDLLVRVGNLVTDIEENPRKYFKFSVF